jgi:hypothetical protein
MPALREVFAEFGVEFDRRRALERGNRRVERSTRLLRGLGRVASGIGDAIGTIGTAFAAATTAMGVGLRSMVASTVESTQELGRWAARLGIGITELQGWHRAAQTFGADMDDITDGLKEIQLKARDALTGTQSYIDAFALLGITVDQLRPVVNDQTALMELFTDALNRNTSAATQNFVADELMSDAGTRLLPMLRSGTANIRRLRREAEQLGGRDMPQLAKRTADYVRVSREMDQRWAAMRNGIMVQVLPPLIQFIELVGRAITGLQELSRETRLFEGVAIAAILAVAAVLAATLPLWGPWAAAIGGVVLIVGALALLIDDVWTAMEGGQSVVGDLGEAMADWLRTAIQGTGILANQLQSLLRTYNLIAGVLNLPPIALEGFTGEAGAAQRAGQTVRGAVGTAGAAAGQAFGGGGGIANLGIPGIQRTAQGAASRGVQAPLFRPEDSPRVTPMMRARSRQPVVTQKVNIPQTNNITVNEAEDPEATRRVVRREVDAANQRQLRQLEAASVPQGQTIGVGVGG